MFIADLHIHSKFSRATGKDADLQQMALWARKKDVTVVGTGDFTHPQWMKELREKLVPAEPGLFRLRDDLERDVQRQLNESGSSDSAAATSTQADSAAIAQAPPEELRRLGSPVLADAIERMRAANFGRTERQITSLRNSVKNPTPTNNLETD